MFRRGLIMVIFMVMVACKETAKSNKQIQQIEDENSVTKTTDSPNKEFIKFESERIERDAALVIKSISIKAMAINEEKAIATKKSSDTKKVLIAFRVKENPLARKGFHEVYLRVQDRNGKVVDGSNSKRFIAIDDQLQYTYKTAIDFSRADTGHIIEWTNVDSLMPNTYDISLFADGYPMGRSSITLK